MPTPWAELPLSICKWKRMDGYMKSFNSTTNCLQMILWVTHYQSAPWHSCHPPPHITSLNEEGYTPWWLAVIPELSTEKFPMPLALPDLPSFPPLFSLLYHIHGMLISAKISYIGDPKSKIFIAVKAKFLLYDPAIWHPSAVSFSWTWALPQPVMYPHWGLSQLQFPEECHHRMLPWEIVPCPHENCSSSPNPSHSLSMPSITPEAFFCPGSWIHSYVQHH